MTKALSFTPSPRALRIVAALAGTAIILALGNLALTVLSNAERVDEIEQVAITASEAAANAGAVARQNAQFAAASQTSRFKNGVQSCEDRLVDRVNFAGLVDDLVDLGPGPDVGAPPPVKASVERRFPTDLNCETYSAQRVCRSGAERASAPCQAYSAKRIRAGLKPWPPPLEKPDGQ